MALPELPDVEPLELELLDVDPPDVDPPDVDPLELAPLVPLLPDVEEVEIPPQATEVARARKTNAREEIMPRA